MEVQRWVHPGAALGAQGSARPESGVAVLRNRPSKPEDDDVRSPVLVQFSVVALLGARQDGKPTLAGVVTAQYSDTTGFDL